MSVVTIEFFSLRTAISSEFTSTEVVVRMESSISDLKKLLVNVVLMPYD